jgi:pectin methylesterase-like acyl-CoA thioesterase
MLSKLNLTMAFSLALAACAGRDPTPVASVQQPQDMYSDCTTIRAELAAKDAAALQAHQQYRPTLAEQQCAPGYRPPAPSGSSALPQSRQ